MSEATSIYVLVLSMLLFTVFALFTILYIALQKKKQYRNSLEKQEMEHRFKTQLMRSKLEVQEQTLKNLSAELHDNIAPLLGLAKMQVTVLRDNIAEDWRSMSVETAAMIDEAIQGVRGMSHVMNGTYILRTGLAESVKKDMVRVAAATRIACNVTENGEPFSLGEDRELILFRIVQECVANAVKHAAPSVITVSINYMPGSIKLCVEDDGKGFDTAKLATDRGIGLENIEERAKLLNGTVDIASLSGKGTKVYLEIPS